MHPTGRQIWVPTLPVRDRLDGVSMWLQVVYYACGVTRAKCWRFVDLYSAWSEHYFQRASIILDLPKTQLGLGNRRSPLRAGFGA